MLVMSGISIALISFHLGHHAGLMETEGRQLDVELEILSMDAFWYMGAIQTLRTDKQADAKEMLESRLCMTLRIFFVSKAKHFNAMKQDKRSKVLQSFKYAFDNKLFSNPNHVGYVGRQEMRDWYSQIESRGNQDE